jgi:glyoxylase-like metal-dependent hydrolase (beta-lactamase superfamily II)
MASERRAFKVGDIDCVALSDGTFKYPATWFFSNVPNQQLEDKLREANFPTAEVVSPYTCLLVKTGTETLLIDTGADGLAPTTGDLQTNLAAQSVRPDQITTVVLTHAHPDHIGGVLNSEGKAAFPNARYIMAKTEWDFWTSGPDLRSTALDSHIQDLLINCAQKNLPPLKPRIELLEKEREIAPGIVAVPAPGHTPGHIAVVISSAKQQLLHIADAVLHPMHMRYPSWRNVFDLNENDAVTTRQKLLDRAAADKCNMLAYHFPFPGLGTVATSGAGWQWEPINS